MYKIQVLLSTYNGEKYVKEQLNSILNQKNVQVSLLIRDDGSTDSTIDILKEYCKKNKNIKLLEAQNVGVIRSFFKLFREADTDYDFYALSDQDDVWDDDKLYIACETISNSNADFTKPILYCCESDITDFSSKEKKHVASGQNQPLHKKPGFGNALIENIARGGGIVFNKSLLDMLQIEYPQGCYMHDWWLYLTASCFGKVIYDSHVHYKYRQHEGNVLGATTSRLGRMKKRLTQSKTNKGHVSLQAKAFSNAYRVSENKSVPLKVITDYRTSFKQRIRGISGKYLYRQSKSDNLIFKLLFLTNHL